MLQKKEVSKIITMTNVTKQYGNKTAVDNFNLEIAQGERIAIIGANGSGKSTISEIMSGIRKPTTGTVIKKDNTIIGIQFQDSRYPHGLTVMDMIKYYLQTFNIEITKEQLHKMLETYQILKISNAMVQNLSGGQQQRLNILLSIIHKPDLVILDEVSTGLDIEVKEEIFEFLQTNIIDKNIALVLVSHNMSEIERFCDRVIFMNAGKIIEDTTVSAIIKEYGSCTKYMHQQLWKYKKSSLVTETNAESKTIKNGNQLVTRTNMTKYTSLLELIAKYFIRGFNVPFFIFLYPILTLFLQGYAFTEMGFESLQKLVLGVAVMQIIAIGIFFIPQTVIEFKASVLMKRIGATNIRPAVFVSVIIAFGIIFSVIAFLWTLLWAGIFFGKYGPGFSWKGIVLPNQLLPTILFLSLVLISSIGLGMMMAALLKTQATFLVVANIIYFPIAFLSGGIVSMDLIEKSKILKYMVYISPFEYCVNPFMNAWLGTFKINWEFALNVSVSLIIITMYMVIASWKLKWQA